MDGLDPFLWQNLLLFAAERERTGDCIASSELPARCGIPSDDAVRYLLALGESRGWMEVDPHEVIIPVYREKEKVGA